MAGSGTGSPLYFVCPVARRNQRWDPTIPGRAAYSYPPGHEAITRTGRTRPNTGKRGARMLPDRHEYVCECGHVGWSAHRNIVAYRLVPPVEMTGHADTCDMMVRLLTGDTCTCGFDPPLPETPPV